MVLKKHEIEAALHAEHQDIAAGRLKEDNPLDQSEGFLMLCEASRRGDLRECQQRIQEGVNINARDRYDYTPLILASLCGHFEVVQLLLEAGALCERDTFQGERALYNALNDRIRNILLSYDYSKSRDPLQPFAGHITSLLTRETPQTSDIVISTDDVSFHLHKFVLSARSPYFASKLSASPGTTTWRVPASIPSKSLDIALRFLYLGEVSVDFHGSEEDQAIITGIEKIGRQLEMDQLFDIILESDRRLARQKRSDEVSRGRDQLEEWFIQHILGRQIHTETDNANSIAWNYDNMIFADVLLRADEPLDSSKNQQSTNGIPVGPLSMRQAPQRSVIFPAHRAMLIRSEYFNAMFTSPFREAQAGSDLPIIHMDCSPEVLRVVLTYLYTEFTNFDLDTAIDVLFTADQLFIEKLKIKAAVIISTLGNGPTSSGADAEDVDDLIDVYDVVRAGWDTRVPRLEEFGARYLAYRLERFIDEPDFMELVKESAARIKARQETDTVELIDDIRYYLSERFRLRFEDSGFDTLEQSEADQNQSKMEPLSEGSFQDPVPSTDDGTGVIRTLDGEIAGDEFAQDSLNYQLLLGKIDTLLDNLELDA